MPLQRKIIMMNFKKLSKILLPLCVAAFLAVPLYFTVSVEAAQTLEFLGTPEPEGEEYPPEETTESSEIEPPFEIETTEEETLPDISETDPV